MCLNVGEWMEIYFWPAAAAGEGVCVFIPGSVENVLCLCLSPNAEDDDGTRAHGVGGGGPWDSIKGREGMAKPMEHVMSCTEQGERETKSESKCGYPVLPQDSHVGETRTQEDWKWEMFRVRDE